MHLFYLRFFCLAVKMATL